MVGLGFSEHYDCESSVGNRPVKYGQLFSCHSRTSLQGICNLNLASPTQGY